MKPLILIPNRDRENNSNAGTILDRRGMALPELYLTVKETHTYWSRNASNITHGRVYPTLGSANRGLEEWFQREIQQEEYDDTWVHTLRWDGALVIENDEPDRARTVLRIQTLRYDPGETLLNTVVAPVDDDVRQKIRNEHWDELWDEARDEIKQGMRREEGGAIREEIKEDHEDELRQEAREEIKAEMRQDEGDDIREEVKEDHEDELWQEAKEDVKRERHDELREEIMEDPGEELLADARDKFQAEHHDRLWEEAKDELMDQNQELWNEAKRVLIETNEDLWEEARKELMRTKRVELYAQAKQAMVHELAPKVKEAASRRIREHWFTMLGTELDKPANRKMRLQVQRLLAKFETETRAAGRQQVAP